MGCIIQYASRCEHLAERRTLASLCRRDRASATTYRVAYFLRKRSSRTTSAPSPGFSSDSASSTVWVGTDVDNGAVTWAAGRFVAAASAMASDGSNCRPNWTVGSKKLLIAAN